MLGNRSNLSATCVSIITAKQAAPNICKSREPFTLSNLRFIWYAFPIDDARPRTQARQRLGNQREAASHVIARAAVEPHAVAILAFDDRKPSCLISCSHRSPEGNLSVFVGRHGAMNPAAKVRCSMWAK